MNKIYKKLIDGQERFGIPYEKVAAHLKVNTSLIKKNVVIAPTMTYECFKNYNPTVDVLYNKYHAITNMKIENNEFTFITTGMGAPIFTDIVLSLGVTECENILFIGSAGALDEYIGIGDIVIPKCSVSGEGTSYYLTEASLSDANTFGERNYPDKDLLDLTCDISKKICEENNINWYSSINYSTDSVFAQFAYIDEIKALKCNTIDMETSALFRAAEIAGIRSSAIFTISDNTVQNKSLFNGRTEEDKKKKGFSRYEITPKIVLEILNNLK